ncbi:bZIP transcription factor 18 [Glycine soja]|uniref:BZIP transcription factor 18 n=1 Tax=Glycine soja TaxID=3848 RepID=A0A445L3Q6_GLYSO|nr:bZIP transcription factor 18-like [Glycine soja]RZC17792.1 bZIP transcription factor 18 [Glycine soja]
MSFSHHRRSQSEMHFRISDDFDLEVDLSPSHHFQDPAPLLQDSGSIPQSPQPETARSAHQRSNSADASSSSLVDGIEAKKALSPDKLAELWTADPKRAKRILANRQSAARSKERKACYVLQLERKFQSLQTEATALCARLSLFQRDTTGLTTENTELKLRLQAMEQQANLCDALNEALKKEVDGLKIATGEIVMHNAHGLGMHPLTYSQAPFFSHQSQHGQSELQAMQMPQLHSLSSNVPTSDEPLFDLDIPYDLSEMLSSESIGQFQGLDIGDGVLHNLMPDCPSISVNNINNAF